jgi:hypothetical protein
MTKKITDQFTNANVFFLNKNTSQRLHLLINLSDHHNLLKMITFGIAENKVEVRNLAPCVKIVRKRLQYQRIKVLLYLISYNYFPQSDNHIK